MQSHASHSTRLPAVAGAFYPSSSDELRALVDELVAQAPRAEGACPKALIVPHAGLVYSGPIAASAYALLVPFGERIERVVVVGPAHRARVHGLASPGAARLRTPLGDMDVDVAALDAVPTVHADGAAHAREHSVEVQLPFLQRVAPRASIVPIVVGSASAEEVGRVLEALWGGPETVIVVSSDLSHYLPYELGRRADAGTARRIVAKDERPLLGDEACGAAGINGLLWVARKRGLVVDLLDLRSSGDTAGSRSEVVGYGAFALREVAS